MGLNIPQTIRKLQALWRKFGGQTLPAFFAGATSLYPGLDQVNVALPASLAGSGTIFVTVSVSTTASAPAMISNPVAVKIQ
jgi:uncharacterized protein (TIGR03437 family)